LNGDYEMVDGQPQSLVFTTCRFNESGQVLAWNLHLNRMEEAAEKIRCQKPDSTSLHEALQSSINEHGPREGLARLEWTSKGEVNCETRDIQSLPSPLVAITYPAPQWPRRLRGIKHGSWEQYLKAGESAKSAGADIALLVHNHTIVDADRATPILLDENGLAYSPGPDQGGVASITLSLITEHLEKNGIPLRRAFLTDEMLLRCKEMVVVGTGLGVLPIGEIDGVDISIGNHLTNIITDALKIAWEGTQHG